MLPFLKKEHEGSASMPSEEATGYGLLDAVAEDMYEAFEKKDKKLFKSALEAFCEYIKEEDTKQDQSLTNKE